MGLGGTYRLGVGGECKVIIWGDGGEGQATIGCDQFLLREVTPWDTRQRFLCSYWRRARLDEMIKKWGRERFYI